MAKQLIDLTTAGLVIGDLTFVWIKQLCVYWYNFLSDIKYILGAYPVSARKKGYFIS